MICPRCLRRMPPISLRLQPSASTQLRATYQKPLQLVSARPITLSSALRQDQQATPSDATNPSSTAAAQPSDAPKPSSQKPSLPASQPSKKPAHPEVVSSVSAGTVLRGLNYFKNKPDPVALEDAEYPPWLWTILSESKKDYAGTGKVEMDPRLFSRSAKARRMARKRARLEAQQNPDGLNSKTPIFAQSVDLPADLSGEAQSKAAEARMELTRAMRAKRRTDIKEANFLKGMR